MKYFEPLSRPEQFLLEATAPPSKAHTLRAIFMAALAKGTSELSNPLLGSDQYTALACISQLGAQYKQHTNSIEITGMDSTKETKHGTPIDLSMKSQNQKSQNQKKQNHELVQIDCGESGLSARIVTAIAFILNKDISITGGERMQTSRPLTDLIASLRSLGLHATFHKKEGYVPLTIHAINNALPNDLPKQSCISISTTHSSQFLTALLLIAPYIPGGLTIKTSGLMRSLPYIKITLELMHAFGVDVQHTPDYSLFEIPPQAYCARIIQIEGDYSSAAFLGEAAALTGGKSIIHGLTKDSAQGDAYFFEALEQMGCALSYSENQLTISGKPYKPLDIDMHDYPDIVIPLALVMAHTPGKHTIKNIDHLRLKESDRVHALAENLDLLGVPTEETHDCLSIAGKEQFNPDVTIRTYNDHRVAMGFALAGLVTSGIRLDNPNCVSKSFPNFWDIFAG